MAQIKIDPCAFCGGPPVPDCREVFSKREVFAGHRRNDQEAYEAYVWCHDCGARGPRIDSLTLEIFENKSLTVDKLIRRAIREWNTRHTKALNLYSPALAIYPRADQ